jgi:hypothetical protein
MEEKLQPGRRDMDADEKDLILKLISEIRTSSVVNSIILLILLLIQALTFYFVALGSLART